MRIGVGRGDVGPSHAALGAAVGDHGDLAQAGLDRGLGARNHGHERGAAHVRGVVVARLDAEVFGQRQRGHAALRGGGEQPVDLVQAQAAVVQRARRGLRHEVEGAEAGHDFAQVGFGGADDGDAAALQGGGHAGSSISKTG